MTNQGLTVFNGFFLAAFEAGGNRPQPQGLRASVSREAHRLGVKTGGVPLGFKRSKMFFMVFIQNFLKNQINTHPLYFL